MLEKKGADKMKQITFGTYKSYDDLYLILNDKTIGSPEPKKNQIEVEGGDGVIDLTEIFGRINYNNRTLAFNFSTLVQPFMAYYSAIQDALNGKRMKITLDEDSNFYYMGRITVGDFTNEKNIGKISIECDCDPYKYKKDVTVVSQVVDSSITITLNNLKKRVVPTITTNATMTFEYGGTTVTHNAGTFKLSTFELVEGENIVTIKGTGIVSFSYQEGRL